MASLSSSSARVAGGFRGRGREVVREVDFLGGFSGGHVAVVVNDLMLGYRLLGGMRRPGRTSFLVQLL
jgi:hypothetical protein